MGNDNSNLKEKLNKVFVTKYVDYLELMKVAGCSDEELETKVTCLAMFNELSITERANVVKDDMSFLDFFTSGGIVYSDDSGNKLYSGINKEVGHSILGTMDPCNNVTIYPKEYEDELEEPVTLLRIKDMISGDMSSLFDDMKKMFLLGSKDEFHSRMTKIFKDSKDLETFSDIVDASVYNKSEAGIYQYMDMIREAIEASKEMNFNKKGLNL